MKRIELFAIGAETKNIILVHQLADLIVNTALLHLQTPENAITARLTNVFLDTLKILCQCLLDLSDPPGSTPAIDRT
jgi:hypothetical protein